MPNFINCTPHPIVLNNGTVYAPSGQIARVSSSHTPLDANGVCRVVYGDLVNVPDPAPDTLYIVSALVLGASDRKDLVAPATGHPDCVRDAQGHIVSVPGFVTR